jgi:pimeloyl-ACP methyl ester carboxylesterase
MTMLASPFSSVNGTIVRSYSAWITLLRAYFGLTSRVLPGVARQHAERLFTRPPQYRGRQPLPVPARRETVATSTHELSVWQTGPASAPAVLLAHGWGGRGVQMGRFVEPLLERGFRVVWFDQPGHGESGHGPVGLPDLSSALHALAVTHGPFDTAIGHSLGAAAIALALRAGLPVRQVVFLSPPASMNEHTRNFARRLCITSRVREAMRTRLENRYRLPFAEIDRIEELEHVRIPALFVHDNDDSEVPIEHARRLSAHMAGARLIRTHGLGHHRILRDPAVVRAVIDFVQGNDSALPAELPELPIPAPMM